MGDWDMTKDKVEGSTRILGWDLAIHYGPSELEAYGTGRGITWTWPGTIDGVNDREP